MISITHPVPHEVIQRATNNVGFVVVEGVVADGVTCVAVEFTPHADFPNQGEKTGRFLIYPAAGKFSGKVPVKGGWYQLKATPCIGKEETTTAVITPVGVGEVFVLFGHSVIAGDPTGWVGASDKRVSAPNHVADNANVAFEFGQLGDHAPRGPFNSDPTGFGYLGDMLVQRLRVPVSFYGAAFGGTNIEQNWKVINRIPFNHGFVSYEKGMPYEPLRKSLNDFGQKTGVRAVLTQHGINDHYRDETLFYNEFREVIAYTRNLFDQSLAFILVLDHDASSGTDPQRNAIRKLWELPGVYPGFDYLEMTSTIASDTDKVHPKLENEWKRYASLWNASISDSFLEKSTPILSRSTAPMAAPETTTKAVVLPQVSAVTAEVKRSSIFAGPVEVLKSIVPRGINGDIRRSSPTTKIFFGVILVALIIALIIESQD